MASLDIRILGLLVFGLFFGVTSFFKGLKWIKEKREIEDIPTSEIRSIAMGLVEIYGEVVPIKGKILKSPLSNNDCVYFKFTIEEERGSGKNRHWEVIKRGNAEENFLVRDQTGEVLVNPEGADIDIPLDFQFQSGWGKDPPQTIVSFLKNNNLSFEGFLGINKKMRFKEYYLAPGDHAFVMGTAGDNPFIGETQAKSETEDIMIQKGDTGQNYYISDRSKKDVLNEFRNKVFLGIYGGAALSTAMLFIIFLYFGLI